MKDNKIPFTQPAANNMFGLRLDLPRRALQTLFLPALNSKQAFFFFFFTHREAMSWMVLLRNITCNNHQKLFCPLWQPPENSPRVAALSVCRWRERLWHRRWGEWESFWSWKARLLVGATFFFLPLLNLCLLLERYWFGDAFNWVTKPVAANYYSVGNIRMHRAVQSISFCECVNVLRLLSLQSQLIQNWSGHKQLPHLPKDSLHHLQVTWFR